MAAIVCNRSRPCDIESRPPARRHCRRRRSPAAARCRIRHRRSLGSRIHGCFNRMGKLDATISGHSRIDRQPEIPRRLQTSAALLGARAKLRGERRGHNRRCGTPAQSGRRSGSEHVYRGRPHIGAIAHRKPPQPGNGIRKSSPPGECAQPAADAHCQLPSGSAKRFASDVTNSNRRWIRH